MQENEQAKDNNDNSISGCSKKKIPLWLVLLDNLPTLLLFTLGFLIIYPLSVGGAVFFGIYALFSVIWFWARICPCCHHYNTLACPCGYGAISARLFKQSTDKSFKKVFRQNILIMFPNWFVPLAAAIYMLITRFSNYMLILTAIFCVTGFIIIPVISKLVGCKNCEIKDDCPWMMKDKKV